MKHQMHRIKNKLQQLKTLDKSYKLFGSEVHQYYLNPIISIDKVKQFETTYNILLPNEYVLFITEIGNG